MPKNQNEFETEPDYTISLKCIECGHKVEISGQYADYHEIDKGNYVCNDCKFIDDKYL